MSREWYCRTEMLLGTEAMEKLFGSRVAVFGIGGVGGYVVEALCRAGIGALDLIDRDIVSESNLNRQIIATRATLGKEKTAVAAERVRSINPECKVRTCQMFFLPETESSFDFTEYDYVVDAIDTVSGKLAIIEKAKKEGVPVISCMGTGNKLNPAMLETADLYETSVCPLAKVMRRECRKRNIEHLKVVYSKEEPLKPKREAEAEQTGDESAGRPQEEKETAARKKDTPGSTSFVPAAAGLLIASEVIRDLVGKG